MNYAIINTKTKLCENIIRWDGQSDWDSPEDSIVVPHTEIIIKNIEGQNLEEEKINIGEEVEIKGNDIEGKERVEKSKDNQDSGKITRE